MARLSEDLSNDGVLFGATVAKNNPIMLLLPWSCIPFVNDPEYNKRSTHIVKYMCFAGHCAVDHMSGGENSTGGRARARRDGDPVQKMVGSTEGIYGDKNTSWCCVVDSPTQKETTRTHTYA